MPKSRFNLQICNYNAVYQICQLYYKKAFMEIKHICMYIQVVIVTYMILNLVVVIFESVVNE